MVDTSKMSKEDYVNYSLSKIDYDAIKENWKDFSDKYKRDTGKYPEYWTNFMELDDADLTDLEILSSIDSNFEDKVFRNITIINDEVSEKIYKKTSEDNSDHIQLDIEGGTGVGKSTLMLSFSLHFFPDFSVDDIFYMKKNLLDYVAENSEQSKRSMKVLDEDVKSKGIGSGRTDDDLSQLFESCRKAGLSYCGCHAVAKHENQTVYYRFLVFAKNTRRRITCCAVYRMNVCIGFIQWRIQYTKEFFELEWEYNQKKDKFITSTMRNKNMETLDIKKCALQVLEDEELKIIKKMGKLNKKNIKLKVYELFNNFTVSEQDLIIEKVNIIRLSEELGVSDEDEISSTTT